MQREIKTVEVYIGYFHKYLDRLPNSKRAFVDEIVHADHYYLIYNHSLVIGGFATKADGEVSGFFTLIKGYSDIFLDLVLTQAEIDSDAHWFNLLCCGKSLREYYLKYGWTVDAIHGWDELKKHKLWNKETMGEPYFYTMSIRSTL